MSLRAASPPPHWQKPIVIKSCRRDSANPAALSLSRIDGPFCNGHFNPFRSFFFLLWIWTVTITRPNVKT